MSDDELEPVKSTWRSWRGSRRVSEVPREVVVGIDATERKVSYVAGAIALILAVILLPHLLHNTTVIDTAKLIHHKCASGYKIVNGACHRARVTHPSDWIPQFAEIIIFGALLVTFAWRSKRSGVAVCALFLGLALGTVGLPFLFLGGWLIIRALRLQRYGDASFAGSNRRAKEKAREKRDARGTVARSTPRGAVRGSSRSSAKSAAAKPSGPAPSKRYTPKQKPRKR